MTNTHTSTVRVDGMTCGHCVRAVSTELLLVSGVLAVAVDLPSGTVTVTSTGVLDDAAVAGAVYEAGCEVAA